MDLICISGRLLMFICRGPADGYRGKVVLPCEENENGSAKVGVRFDRTIAEGNDLGGHCEKEHGFFCSGDCLAYLSSVIIPRLHFSSS